MNEIFYKVNDVVYRISEGDGGNLLKEDIENGYVDYIYYEIYNADDLDNEIDGGMILLKEYFQDKYKSTEDAIEDVMNFVGCEERGKVIDIDL